MRNCRYCGVGLNDGVISSPHELYCTKRPKESPVSQINLWKRDYDSRWTVCAWIAEGGSTFRREREVFDTLDQAVQHVSKITGL